MPHGKPVGVRCSHLTADIRCALRLAGPAVCEPSPTFSANPLWIPHDASSVGTLPASWTFRTIWQNADSGVFPGDQNKFNGGIIRLLAFALGLPYPVALGADGMPD